MALATVTQALEIAVRLHQTGRETDALEIYRQILARRADLADAWHLAGVVLRRQGAWAEAEVHLRRAVALRPGEPAYLNSLGEALLAAGRPVEAFEPLRQGLGLAPRDPALLTNLAQALWQTGQRAEAVRYLESAAAIEPASGALLSNLAKAYLAVQQYEAARAAAQRAVQADPALADAFNTLAIAWRLAGDPERALEACTQALALAPDLPEAVGNQAMLLHELGRADEALAAARRAVALDPRAAGYHCTLASLLREADDLDAAREAAGQAVRVAPADPQGWNELGVTELAAGRLDEALAAYDQAVALGPDLPIPHANRISLLNYHPDYDLRAILEAHRVWAARHAAPFERLPPRYDPALDRDPDRRLRVGYVSPDLRLHVVGRNLLPLLERHDPSAVEVICYATNRRADALTGRLRDLAHHWLAVAGWSDEHLADRIAGDRVDVLVDCSMQMLGNRLLVFARRPAPVQVTFLACPGTTGLSSIGYRITDPYLDPPGLNDELYSERSLRLPHCYWCYQVFGSSPPVGPLPALGCGQVTFGTLSTFCKVTEPALRLWARVLRAVPGSRLLLLAPRGSARERVRAVLAAEGVAPDRLACADRTDWMGYMRLYDQVDIGLDPFPYNGHTTTCDSLWMGVPVLTVPGRTGFARGGLSLLSNAGLEQWVARDADDLVERAASWAADLDRLAALRRGLREQVQASRLCDATAFARGVEGCYRSAWRAWCAAPAG